MPLIKLDATDSTNDYLKQLNKISALENYTIVMANEQTGGKGQMGAKWISQKGKNLTMSVLVNDPFLTIDRKFDLNIAVALSAINVLKNLYIPKVTIKWPNDIMADSKKVAGILIENALKADGSFTAVVGIGLNLNQTNFGNLQQAISLTSITHDTYNLEDIAISLRESLKKTILEMSQNADILWSDYHENLYKINYPSAFEDKLGNRFMGIIRKVTRDGMLEISLQDNSTIRFAVKEIKML